MAMNCCLSHAMGSVGPCSGETPEGGSEPPGGIPRGRARFDSIRLEILELAQATMRESNTPAERRWAELFLYLDSNLRNGELLPTEWGKNR